MTTTPDDASASRRLLEASPIPMGYVDAELTVRACTSSAAEVLGRSVKEIVGQPVETLFRPDGDVVSALKGVSATGIPRRLHLQDTSPDGRVRHWEVSMVPESHDAGPVGVVLAGVDVSDLVDAQLRVAQSESLHRAIGELLPYGTWTAEGDGGLTYLSDSFIEMTGLDGASLLGWGWLDLLPTDEDRLRARADWAHALSEMSIRDAKHAIRAKDGSVRHVLCRGVRVSDDSNGVQRWAGIHLDVTDSERSLMFRNALSDVKDLLMSAHDTDQLLERVAGAVLAPTGADFAAVLSRQQGQWLEIRHAAGSYSQYGTARLLRQTEMPLMVRAYESEEIQVVTDALSDSRMNTDRARADGLRSIAVLPVRRCGITICLFALVYTTSHLADDHAFRNFLADLTDSLDLALQGTQAHEQQRHIAETLQESLLAIPAHLPNVEIAHLYEAAIREERVGGDFYDAFSLREEVAVIIGDISGSGLEAAALTALAKNTIRAHLLDQQTPAGALAKANTVMHTFTELDEFATVFVGVLDPLSGRLTYASAGHPPPFVVGRNGARPLDGGGLLLGAFGDADYLDYETFLSPSETLVMYTDGITEARSGSTEYGDERLAAVLAQQDGADPSAIVERLFDDARTFAAGELGDDVAVLAVRAVGNGA